MKASGNLVADAHKVRHAVELAALTQHIVGSGNVMNDTTKIEPLAADDISHTYDPVLHITEQAPRTVPRNVLSGPGATALAAELDAWWHKRGYLEVAHWTERALARRPNTKSDSEATTSIYVIRSNLVNGLPPGHRCYREGK